MPADVNKPQVILIFLISFTLIYLTLGHPTRSKREVRLCHDRFLYHNKTEKCYPYGKQGPCGEMAYFVPKEKDSRLGSCQCRHEVCNLNRPKVYLYGSCFHLFERGPCKSDEWLVPKGEDSASCKKIPCPAEFRAQRQSESGKPDEYGELSGKFLFPYKNKCYRTEEEGFPICNKGDRVYFDAHADDFDFLCDPDPSSLISCTSVGAGIFDTPKGCADDLSEDSEEGCDPLFDEVVDEESDSDDED